MHYNPAMVHDSVAPLISVVIPNYNGAAHLEVCLLSLLRQTYPSVEIVVADNASRDGSLELVRKIAPEAVILALNRNLGFAGAANAGLRAARGEWVAVLNNDTEAEEGWLEECAAALQRHPEADFLACRILRFDRRDLVYSAGDCFLRAGVGYRRGQDLPDHEDYRRDTEIFSACGCAALYRRSAFETVGGYDEDFFAYLEDVDLSLRLQAAGCRGVYAARAVVYHRGGVTSGGEFSPLAVRLRTRNALLVLCKSLPARILWRSWPMILAAQLSWLGRVLTRGRLFSYVRGLAGVVPLCAPMLRKRKQLRRHWEKSGAYLWQAILMSESMARKDYQPHPRGKESAFLRWYFRFVKGGGLSEDA